MLLSFVTESFLNNRLFYRSTFLLLLLESKIINREVMELLIYWIIANDLLTYWRMEYLTAFFSIGAKCKEKTIIK